MNEFSQPYDSNIPVFFDKKVAIYQGRLQSQFYFITEYGNCNRRVVRPFQMDALADS